jgi:hypothetical protein
LSEFRVDIGHFKMIVDYYDRRCPCWSGKYTCPCLPFAETKECRCGAVRATNDPKAQNPKFSDFKIDFARLNEVIKNGRKCPKKDEVCFCKQFLETGMCAFKIFEKSHR